MNRVIEEFPDDTTPVVTEECVKDELDDGDQNDLIEGNETEVHDKEGGNKEVNDKE